MGELIDLNSARISEREKVKAIVEQVQELISACLKCDYYPEAIALALRLQDIRNKYNV